MAPPGFVTRGGSRVAELLGLAVGYGLTDDIRHAYAFLADTFEPGDKLFLFGFSRGSLGVEIATLGSERSQRSGKVRREITGRYEIDFAERRIEELERRSH
jgi:Uncharacterized alpha/beta hydrolase domain (DUF2235)